MYVCKEFLSRSNASGMLLALFSRSVFEDKPVCFFSHYCSLDEGFLDHSNQLARKIAELYIDIRLKHYCKLFNRLTIEEGRGSDRGRLNRLVIFKNQ